MSSASLILSTLRQPASAAKSTKDWVLDELADPMTSTASHSGAISISAVCRLVVAKQRSLMLGCHRSGKRRRVCSSTPSHSRCERVVWARTATGSLNSGRAATPLAFSTRWMASGATAIVPTASSWPSWPTYTIL